MLMVCAVRLISLSQNDLTVESNWQLNLPGLRLHVCVFSSKIYLVYLYFSWFNRMNCGCWSRSLRQSDAICTFQSAKGRYKVSHEQVAIFSTFFLINKHLFYISHDPCLCRLCLSVVTSFKLLSLKIISISFCKSIKDIYKCPVLFLFWVFYILLGVNIRRCVTRVVCLMH